MATYVFSYRHPKGYAPSPQSRAQWFDWFEGMGDALINIGQPVSNRSSLGNCDSDTTELGGYSMVSAPDLQAALAIAKGCPHLDRDGGVEVGELADLQANAGVECLLMTRLRPPRRLQSVTAGIGWVVRMPRNRSHQATLPMPFT